jgi:hypothetical protein
MNALLADGDTLYGFPDSLRHVYYYSGATFKQLRRINTDAISVLAANPGAVSQHQETILFSGSFLAGAGVFQMRNGAVCQAFVPAGVTPGATATVNVGFVKSTFGGAVLIGYYKDSVAGRVAQGAAFGYAGDVAQGLIDKRDDPLTPGFGTGVGAGLPLAGRLVGSLLKRGVALTTGAGREVIDRAIHNPDAVHDAIREYAKTDASKQGLVSRAKAAVFDFLGERGEEFVGKVKGTTFSKPFTKREVTDSFASELAKFKGRVTDAGLKFESTTLTRTTKSPRWSELRIASEVVTSLQWEGFDATARFMPAEGRGEEQ